MLNVDNLERREIIFLVSVFLLAVLLFIGMVLYDFMSDTDKTLKYESEIDMKITKVRSYKGVLTLNDSITISGATPLLKEISKMAILQSIQTTRPDNYNNFKMNFDLLVKPYRIVKKSHTDTITIYQAADTLYFKLFTN